MGVRPTDWLLAARTDNQISDRLNEETKNKEDLAKIVLVDVQNEIYPELEKTFLNIMHGSGYEDLKFTKKINFDEPYKNNKN